MFEIEYDTKFNVEIISQHAHGHFRCVSNYKLNWLHTLRTHNFLTLVLRMSYCFPIFEILFFLSDLYTYRLYCNAIISKQMCACAKKNSISRISSAQGFSNQLIQCKRFSIRAFYTVYFNLHFRHAVLLTTYMLMKSKYLFDCICRMYVFLWWIHISLCILSMHVN